MKQLRGAVLGALLFLSAQASGQSIDSLYIVTYTTGPAWNVAKPPSEQPFFKEHSANVSQWRKEGIVKFGARYADKGILVITAPTLQAARVRIDTEESVAHGLFVADVQRLHVFYDGCIEKPTFKN